MPGAYEIYGDVGGLQGLAAEEQAYLGRFRAIMATIDSHARTTVGTWEGSGQPEYRAAANEYQTHFTAVNNAFAKVIDATDSAANNYAKLCTYLNNLF